MNLKSNGLVIIILTALSFLPALSFAVNGRSPLLNKSTKSNASSTELRVLKRIVVVGGTHGNEYTGVWCIKSLDRSLDRIHTTYPSLEISTLLGNPRAHLENKRFVDEDLNRQFSKEVLLAFSEDEMKYNGSGEDEIPHELIRAREIDQMLGPKFSCDSDNCEKEFNIEDAGSHVIVDLHSTTSNMGLTIIVAEGDFVMTRAAAYVSKKCREAGFTVNILIHVHASRDVRPNLSSTARHGFTIEVGPVPQGVLRHDAVEKTESAIHALFEYLHLYNTERQFLDNELEKNFDAENGRVPCFRSAEARHEGEMSGKIRWPSSSDNPNFPSLMIHKDLQDKDFSLVRTGDALFVDLDGNTILYDGSHGSPIHVMFVNEGGYYYQSSGTGISVAVKAKYDLESGLIIEEDSCQKILENMDGKE